MNEWMELRHVADGSFNVPLTSDSAARNGQRWCSSRRQWCRRTHGRDVPLFHAAANTKNSNRRRSPFMPSRLTPSPTPPGSPRGPSDHRWQPTLRRWALWTPDTSGRPTHYGYSACVGRRHWRSTSIHISQFQSPSASDLLRPEADWPKKVKR